VLPLLLLLLFGFSVSLEVDNINLAVKDLDGTPTSREYIATFERTNQFALVATGPEVNVSQLLKQGKVTAGIIIPPEFSRDLQRRGRAASVQVLVDGTNSNTANIVRGYAQATTNAFIENLRDSNSLAVVVHSRFWYNPGLDSLKYIGPGALALALTLFPPLITGIATVKERERGTILQVYASSLTGSEYLLGKAAAYWLVGMAEVLLVNLVAWPFFGLWLAGDPIPLVLGSCFYIACGVFWGSFLGSATSSQTTVIQAVTITAFLLSLLMSGFIYPVANIPIAMRWISYLVPARYYILLTRDAYTRGVSWPVVWLPVMALALLASFFFFLAWRKVRRMQLEA
jgi:ABC-2 type transport system permease protein